MSYLSQILINPMRRGGQKLLSNPRAMHAAVLQGIPIDPVTERVLWRVELDQPRQPRLLVLTQTKPSWEHVVEQAGWPSSDELQVRTRPYGPLLERVTDGASFAFRLTANPVQATRSPEKRTTAQAARQETDPRRSIRVGHRTVGHQMGWLTSRAARWGIQIPPATLDGAEGAGDDGHDDALDVRISRRQRISFQRGDGGGRVTLQQVTYDGHLVVDDAERLREVLLAGVGKAKAYGCGLLTLAAPMRPS